MQVLVDNNIAKISRISRILEGDRTEIKARFKMHLIAELEYRGRSGGKTFMAMRRS